MRIVYSVIGLLVGAAVNVLLSLIAAAIQKVAFLDQFSRQSIWWLVGLSLGGLLLGYWLSANIQIRPQLSTTKSASAIPNKPVTVNRLKALLSYVRLRGKGIALSDVLTVGSRIDINSRDK